MDSNRDLPTTADDVIAPRRAAAAGQRQPVDYLEFLRVFGDVSPEILRARAGPCGGKGGGRPDMAQAGAKDASALDAALAAVPDWVSSQL